MNRHSRRLLAVKAGVVGTAPLRKVTVPMLQAAVIDPSTMSIRLARIPFSPTGLLSALGIIEQADADRLGQEIVGWKNDTALLLVGDPSPRQLLAAVPEPTWMLRGDNGGPRNVLRGKGVVVGYDRSIGANGKAVDIEITTGWLHAQIEWNPREDPD